MAASCKAAWGCRPMAERYDVIIIGSGAGGGTLAHRLAPSGKKILVLERGDWLPREAQNWRVEDVFGDNRYISPETWLTCRTASHSSRRCIISSAAPPRCSARRSIACARKISARCSTMTAFRPRGRSATKSWSPTTLRPNGSTRCMASVASIRPSRRAARPIRAPPVSNEPRIQKLSDDLAAAGYHPFPAPSAVMLNEADMAHSRCIRCQTCDGFPCLVHAKSDAEVIAVRPALEHPNVTLLRNARAIRLETEPLGRARDRRPGRSRGRPSSVLRPISSSCPAARRIPPRCCCAPPTTSIRRASPTAPGRSAATTCSTTARRCWRCR